MIQSSIAISLRPPPAHPGCRRCRKPGGLTCGSLPSVAAIIRSTLPCRWRAASPACARGPRSAHPCNRLPGGFPPSARRAVAPADAGPGFETDQSVGVRGASISPSVGCRSVSKKPLCTRCGSVVMSATVFIGATGMSMRFEQRHPLRTRARLEQVGKKRVDVRDVLGALPVRREALVLQQVRAIDGLEELAPLLVVVDEHAQPAVLRRVGPALLRDARSPCRRSAAHRTCPAR